MNVFEGVDFVKNAAFNEKILYPKRPHSNNKYLNALISKFPCQLMSRPLMIHIETVNACTNNCIFCAYESNIDRKLIMPIDLFSKIISDYVAIGGGPISFTPAPGEVFLDPFLKKRLQLLEKYPQISSISITTNGLGAEKIEDTDLQYLLSKFDRIHISIYGIEEKEYSNITRRQTYEQCISSIKRIIRYSKPGTVYLGFRLLYNRTENEISEWIQNTFGCLLPFGYTLEYTTWGSLIRSRLNVLPGDARWKDMPRISSPCFRPLISIKIFTNGDVSLCCCSDKSVEDLILGSVINTSLEDLYNSNECLLFWNSGKNVPKSCRYCTTYQSFEYLNPTWFEKPVDYIGG